MNVKKHARRVLSMMLSVCLLLSTVVTAQAASDVDGHWAEEQMQAFIDRGLMNGYGDGMYGPDNSMTRAHYVALINRTAGLTTEADISGYTDVQEGAWYYQDLAKALEAGYMQGTTSTTMSPNATITREQAVTMLARLLKLEAAEEDVQALNSYSDLNQVNNWAVEPFAAMVKEGYVKGTSATTLSPKDTLTRAQGVTILYRALAVLEALNSGSLIDGVYTGTGAGYGGTITVQMTVENGKITNLEVTKHSETSAYYRRALKLLDTILEKQTTEGVDAVSGATRTSNGLLTAVGACISQAQGGEDTSKTGSTGGGGGGAGASTKPEGEDFSGALADGTYTGSARGYSGTTQVTVTVAEGKITKITVDSHGDTTSYFNDSKRVIDDIIANQSTDVDAVSGATYSSWGIINAVADALKEAIPTTAKTYQVADWSEFTAALAKAVDGDTIQLSRDITDAGEDYTTLTKEDGSSYASLVDAVSSATLGMATISKAITIDGQSHSISAGANMAYCFNINGSGVVMKDLTIDGASYGTRMGGGIYLAGGHGATGTPSMEMENVTIKNCKSYKASMPGNGGGAIYCKGAVVLNATGCTFEGNEVVTAGYGGAILAQGATVTLTDCTFTGNKAPYGGAIAATGSANLTVTGSKFTAAGKADNEATYGGNDIYIFDGKTAGKSNSFSNSAVSYALSGNTYSTDGETWKDFAVVLGRYVADETESGGKNYVGSGMPFITKGGHDLTFTDANRTELASEDKTAYKYVLMNIPYDEFYKADVNNDVEVDAVSSSTKHKTQDGKALIAGGYINDDASEIGGVTFPVAVASDFDFTGYTKVTDEAAFEIDMGGRVGKQAYKGKETLFKQAAYSYYELPADEIPAFYKVLMVDGEILSFSKTNGVAQALDGVKASLQTETSYGDYEMVLIGIDAFDYTEDAIYGVILSTEDGNDYGLRHLENIWQGVDLAWCTGFTDNVRGIATDSEHYKSMMGQTITEITYLTSKGIFTIETEVYVPVKFGAMLSVAGADVSDGTATVTSSGFPVDYSTTFAVTNSKGEDVTESYGFSMQGGKLTWNTSAAAIGAYTLTVSDASGVYADCLADFELQTSAMPAKYDGASFSLVKAEAATTDEELAAYLSSITSVKVNGTAYAASGRNSVVVIMENGTVDLTASPFAKMQAEDTYELEVTAAGYSTTLTLTVTIPETLYGTADLLFKEYYSGDVSSTESYGIDGVTSATVQKYKGFNGGMLTNYTEDAADGYNIYGVKNVNVAVAAADCAAYKALEETFTLDFGARKQYKTVTIENGEAVYSATKFNLAAIVDDAEATLQTGSTWGDYMINVTETSTAYIRNNRSDEGWAINANIQGMILETEDRLKVGMQFLQSMWYTPYEVSFNVSEESTLNAHIARWDNLPELAKLVGQKVTSITYIMPDETYVYTFADGLYIKPQYTPEPAITGTFGEGMKTVTLSALPEGLENPTLTVGYKVGRNTVYLLENAVIGDSKTFTLSNHEAAEALGEGGAYSVTIKSDDHANYSVAIPMTEAQQTTLEALIELADELLAADPSNSILEEHREEAAELLKNEAATSAEAASLIAELQELTAAASAAPVSLMFLMDEDAADEEPSADEEPVIENDDSVIDDVPPVEGETA